MGTGSSLGQLLFGTATFLAEGLLRIKISTEELLFKTGTSAQHQLLHKSYIFIIKVIKVNFSENKYSALPTFSGELPFQSGYLF